MRRSSITSKEVTVFITIQPESVRLMLSPEDVSQWQVHARWPGPAPKMLDATFDKRGLVDHHGFGADDASLFNAITFDMLVPYIPPSHACYEVIIGQFRADASGRRIR